MDGIGNVAILLVVPKGFCGISVNILQEIGCSLTAFTEWRDYTTVARNVTRPGMPLTSEILHKYLPKKSDSYRSISLMRQSCL